MSFKWISKYLNDISLQDFLNFSQEEKIKLIASSFSNYLKFAVNTAPQDEQLANFIYQIDEALDTKQTPYISVRSGHGTGKTYVLANLSNYIGLTKDDAKIVLTAPVAAQLKNQLIPELKKWSKYLYPPLDDLVEIKSMEAIYGRKNINKAIGRTARKENSEALAGVHGKFVLYVVDEASGVDRKIFDVIKGALTGEDFLFVMASNPTRTTGEFYDSHNEKRKFYRTIHLNCEHSARVNKTWIESMKEQYGEDSDTYRVRVKGNFPKAQTNSVFSLEDIENLFNKKRIIDDSGNEIWGMDIARFGDDKSVLYKRKGYRGMGFISWEKLDTMQTASKFLYEYNVAISKPNYAFFDTIGVGAGVFDRVSQLGLNDIVLEANASLKATNSIYFNKRTEMYFNLLEAIKKGFFTPYDKELEEELSALTYSITPNGLLKLVSKDEIKESLGRSPDRADSLALSFFEILPAQEYKKDDYVNNTFIDIPTGAWL